jgi:enamine deaminase RidA (YjgF/YER057c/UK114 family)
MLLDTTDIVASSLTAMSHQLRTVLANQALILKKLGVIMSDDAAIQAVTADVEQQVAAEGTVMSEVADVVDQLLSEVSSGTASVSPATLAALQAAQSHLDTAMGSAEQQVAAEQAEAAPPAPPAPAGP